MPSSPLHKFTRAQLAKRCVSLGVPNTGVKAVLIERIELAECGKRNPLSEIYDLDDDSEHVPRLDNGDIDNSIPDFEVSRSVAITKAPKVAFASTPVNQGSNRAGWELENNITPDTVFATKKHHNLGNISLSMLEALSKRVNDLETAEKARHEIDILHNDQMQRLLASDEAYSNIRNCFFATYKQVCLGLELDLADHDCLRERTNKEARSGDAMYDATMYQDGKRSDEEIFTDLYGLSWGTVMKLSMPFLNHFKFAQLESMKLTFVPTRTHSCNQRHQQTCFSQGFSNHIKRH
jgi:hypothetical protein